MTSPDSMIGRTLGSYRIEARIGRGGMGEIYRAHDVKLDRRVAIKLLARHSATEVDRLRAEARAISALNHPHIVVIHDVGEVEGEPFIVTELVDGMTLRERLQQHDLTLREIIDIGRQMAGALAAAHRQGVIHRDIKPENVMVRPDGYVKVLDFGIAKRSDGTLADEATLDATGSVIVGTPEYMSPEQAAGKSVTFSSDQFSFGVVLYELVTGRSPFRRASPVQTAAAVIAEDAVPVARLCPDIPPPLWWTIERCLAKRPTERYSSTDDLQRELSAVHERIADARQHVVALPPSKLPQPSTRLVGRDDDAAALLSLMERGDVRWVTITGPGGVGKTRLALHVGRELSATMSGVYFVDLSNITDAALVGSLLSEVLDARPIGSETPLGAVERVLRGTDRPLLLIVDNFEHVASAAVEIAALLECSPGLKVLVSSRSRLNISAEHEFQLAPLAVPTRVQPGQVPALAQTAAVALFVERAKAARGTFALTAENAAAVVDICAALDGLPLAIELAAARVKMLTPSALLSRIRDKRLSLGGGARDLPSRQQTLRAAIEWGYELLAPAEQTLFQRLGVFVGGWTLESAEAVGDARQDLGIDCFDAMASLVDKSLVQTYDTGGDSRFTMLSTLREYALERLAASGDDRVTRRAHAAYALVIAEEGNALTDPAAQIRWLDQCDVEHPNLRAAIDHLIESGQKEWALRLGAALGPFWQARAHLAEGRDRLTRVLAIADGPELKTLRARVEFLLGVLLHSMGDAVAATELHERVLPVYRESGDRAGIAATLSGIGLCRMAAGDGRARQYIEESLAIWRELGDRASAARVLTNLATLSLEEGRQVEAIRLYRDARHESESIGDHEGAAWASVFEAKVEHAIGNDAAAQALIEEALPRFRARGHGWGESESLLTLGLIAGETGDLERSARLLAESHAASQRVGDTLGTARVIEAAARLEAQRGDASRALTLAGAAAAFRQSLKAPLARLPREVLDRALEDARRRLDAHDASRAWMHGWSLPVDEALRLTFGTDA